VIVNTVRGTAVRTFVLEIQHRAALSKAKRRNAPSILPRRFRFEEKAWAAIAALFDHHSGSHLPMRLPFESRTRRSRNSDCELNCDMVVLRSCSGGIARDRRSTPQRSSHRVQRRPRGRTAIPDELGVLTVALLLALLALEGMSSPFPPISERTKTARRGERITGDNYAVSLTPPAARAP
jgi:hypothetical protein